MSKRKRIWRNFLISIRLKKGEKVRKPLIYKKVY